MHKSTGGQGNIFSQTCMRMVIMAVAITRSDETLGANGRKTKKLNGIEKREREREREREGEGEREASGVVQGRY